MLIFRATSLKHCYLHVLNFYLDNGVMITPKRRILSFVFTVLAFDIFWQMYDNSKLKLRNTITQVKYVSFGFSFRISSYFRFQENFERPCLLEIRIFSML